MPYGDQHGDGQGVDTEVSLGNCHGLPETGNVTTKCGGLDRALKQFMKELVKSDKVWNLLNKNATHVSKMLTGERREGCVGVLCLVFVTSPYI